MHFNFFFQKNASLLHQNPQSTVMKLIRGERRQIQEELANRVLSDISEESSLIDTTTVNSDRGAMGDSNNNNKNNNNNKASVLILMMTGLNKYGTNGFFWIRPCAFLPF